MNKTTRLKKPQIPELDTLYEFDDLGGRPKYGGVEMTSETDIPSFQEIMDETHSAVVAEATARDDADEALQAEIDALSEQTSEALEDEAEARAAADTALREAVNSEASTRGAADNVLQNQIDAIVASSDVKDIVGTKAELDTYDTSTLGDNDIIKVLQDESQSNATTYYRYAEATDSFTLIGSEGPYYTKGQADTLLNAKADKATTYTKTEVDATVSGLEADIAAKQDQLTAGENITIDNNVISTQAGVKEINVSDPLFNANSQVLMQNLGVGIFKIHNDTQSRVTITGGSDGSSVRRTGYIPVNADVIATIGKADNLHYDMLLIGAYTDSGNSHILQYNMQSGGGYPIPLIKDNLTTDSPWFYALSANQGKVLKDMIGDLANLSTTDKTNLVAAINEAASMGGGVTELTSADYNYPTNNPTSVALWLLEPGLYINPNGVQVKVHSSDTSLQADFFTFMVGQKNPLAGSVPIIGISTTSSNQNYGMRFWFVRTSDGNLSKTVQVLDNSYIATAPGGRSDLVMSQGAATSLVFADPGTRQKVRIGESASASGLNSVAIGYAAITNGNYNVGIGDNAYTPNNIQNSVALGRRAYPTRTGEVNVGTGVETTAGFNGSNYRVIGGVYDPQTDHDAATKGYVDTAIAAAGGAEEISAADWSSLWQ